ncbi:uncharacterized protein LOC132933289 [Metopolophium dirhodum]|uniref:uncharacterized protein LOC132933289 n=1 Tax=Metopolophium dirhodum TaxID=44670 RepID=UPI00298FBFDE|nr:uncharacterized protein LOC132933289 [Metopolophium dirhodum]
MSDEEDCANLIINEQRILEDGVSIKSTNKKCEVNWPVKRKIDKTLYNRRRNARIHRLLLPKSALVVFSELFRGVPIQIEEHKLWHARAYTATIEGRINIDGQMYTGNHISKTEAKQKACEQLFRSMLSKQLVMETEQKKYPVKKEAPNLIEPPQEDFPWPHFASIAMHKLINQWKLQPNSEDISLQDKRSFGIPLKVAAPMKMFPLDPTNYQPVSLLAQLRPDVTFNYTILHPVIHANCVIDGIPFTGLGSSKKCAKKECCIIAIKYFWNFDFHNN